MHIKRLYFEDGTGIVIQATGQCQIQFDFILQAEAFQGRKDEFTLFHTLQSCFTCSKDFFQGSEFLFITAVQQNDGLQFGNSLVADTFLLQLGVDIVQTYLIQLIDGHGNIHNLVRLTDDFGNAAQYLAIVNLDTDTDAEAGEYRVYNLHQFHFVQQGITAYHVSVALIELTITPFLRTVGAPHGLYLITLEGESDFIAMHHHVAGKRHCEVIAQTFLAELTGKLHRITAQQFFICQSGEVITGILYLEQELVSFLTILPHQGRKHFHRGRFYLLEAIEVIHFTNRIEYIVTLRHFYRREVTGSFRDTWFCCHNQFNYFKIGRQSYSILLRMKRES